MLKHFPMALAVLAWSTVGPIAAQTQDSAKAPMKMEDHAMSGWKELDAFHIVMMQTWHPASMMKNLQPTREKAAELAQKGAAWSTGTFPMGCDDSLTRAAVAKIAGEAKALGDLVAAKAADDALFAGLKALHQQFESVEKGCKPHKMDD